MSTLVMKFGGSAVGTVTALTQVLSIVLHEQQRWDRLLLVASALDGVTDMLLEAAHLAQIANQRGYRRIAATLRTRHLALAQELPLGRQERSALNADIDRLLFEMLDECQSVANTPMEQLSPAVSDRVIGVGERLSARIIAALLRQNNLRGVAIDGTDVIVTDDVHGNANPLFARTRERVETHLLPMVNRQIVPVVTGFIGATADGKTTTMGRGGSDYTASVLAACVDADEVWVWSDVDGMMSTDPRESADARVIHEMSYDEVAEMAYFGARILHSRMILPLKERRIPLRIKNVYKPRQSGTLIREISALHQGRIIAVTAIHGVSLKANRSGSLADITSLVDQVLFENSGSRADVMIASQSSTSSFLCFVIPTSTGGIEAVDAICAALEDRIPTLNDAAQWQVQAVMVITAIGNGMTQELGLEARILQQLADVRIVGMAQGPSRCSLSVIVQSEDATKALRQVHQLTLNNG